MPRAGADNGRGRAMAPGIGDFLHRLVSSGGEGGQPAAAAVDYKGYAIRPTPTRQGSQWLTAGVITKGSAEGAKEHRFIRAETHATREGAEEFAVLKAKMLIDEQGERLFERG